MNKPVMTDKQPDATAELVAAVEAVARAARALSASRLRPQTLCLLLSQSMPAKERVSPRDIAAVLRAAETLDVACLKPLKKRAQP
jgi:hypothetical protein